MPKNNQWRLRPNKNQNYQEIRKKVLECLNFELRKYENAVKNNLAQTQYDPNTPIEFALNGIGTSYESQERWRHIFYNDDNWDIANDIIEHEFPTDFKVKGYDNKLFQRNIDFLKEMITNIKNSRLEYL